MSDSPASDSPPPNESPEPVPPETSWWEVYEQKSEPKEEVLDSPAPLVFEPVISEPIPEPAPAAVTYDPVPTPAPPPTPKADPAPAPKPRQKTEVHDLLELKGRDSVISEDKPKRDNLRQRRVSWASFLIGQSVILLLLVLGVLWVQHQFTTLPAAAVAAPVAAPSVDVSALQSSLSRAQDQILALQKQIDSQFTERDRTQASLQEMADRMALVIKQASYAPGNAAQNLSVSDASQIAAMLPTVTPAMSELILLKERNRLTEYADKAIASGMRESLQAVVDAMFDPQAPKMQHAAGAEFRRVQAYFEISSSIDPAYKLPLQDLFKDSAIRAEADLKPDQLVKLMHDYQQPWEVRLRCAYLLRASADPATNAALLKTIKDDPSLDVVKQAQTSFEKRVGQRFRLFDIPSIDAWWATQTKK